MTESSAPTPQTTGGYGPDELLAEEEALVLPSFTRDDAIDLGVAALTLATERTLPVVIEIRDLDQVLFRAALPGSSVANDSWIARKTRVVEQFGHSTLYERVRHEAAGTTFAEATGLSEDEYAAHGGGFPLVVEGVGRQGVMVVSGLPQVADHELVVEVLRAHLETS
jgi:uncharacterized protein (UPF0303 family)